MLLSFETSSVYLWKTAALRNFASVPMEFCCCLKLRQCTFGRLLPFEISSANFRNAAALRNVTSVVWKAAALRNFVSVPVGGSCPSKLRQRTFGRLLTFFETPSVYLWKAVALRNFVSVLTEGCCPSKLDQHTYLMKPQEIN